MNFWESIFLGIIQGLTEFIPVSSSGHLEVIPKALGLSEPSTTFIVFLHIGTLFSLLFFYRQKIFSLLYGFFRSFRHSSNYISNETLTLKHIFLASIPALFFGLLFETYIESFYDSPENSKTSGILTVSFLIGVGFIFLFIDKVFKNNNKIIAEISSKSAIFIGISQALAFIRGISRSGITLISAQFAGLTRVQAAEFSFLMSIPILFCTSIYGIVKLVFFQKIGLNQEDLFISILGMTTSFVFGILAIKFLLGFLKKHSLKLFGIYRIIFGLIILILIL